MSTSAGKKDQLPEAERLEIGLARPAQQNVLDVEAARRDLDPAKIDFGLRLRNRGKTDFGGARGLQVLVIAKARRARQDVEDLDMAGRFAPPFEFPLDGPGKRRQVGRLIGMDYTRHRHFLDIVPWRTRKAGGHRLPTRHGKSGCRFFQRKSGLAPLAGR